MDKNVLEEAIKRLEEMRDGFDSGDTESRDKLDQMIAHIKASQDQPASTEKYETLIAKLKQTVLNFESKHPVLTRFIEDLKLKLMNLGL